MKHYEQLIFEVSKPGRRAFHLPEIDVEEKPLEALLPEAYLRKTPSDLPEVSEMDIVRHYTNISSKNYSIDKGFYPLGSCTMKYNPKINEDAAALSGFKNLHPYQPEETIQGALRLMYDLSDMLAEISGMDAVTLQPAAGAQGELTGLMLIKAYHENQGHAQRNKIIVPDSAHGTNPATAAVVGMEIIEIPSDPFGNVDLEALKDAVGEDTAGLMLTNPSTLGLFEKNIGAIAEIVHEAGGLLYYDGANMNAIMGQCRPGDMGFDVMHYNLHKTFSTPHGGGGPGAGPVGVKEKLMPFLPVPMVSKKADHYLFDYERPLTIGKVKSFYGNFSILVRAYTYIKAMGHDGIKEAGETSVLNANYLMHKMMRDYQIPEDMLCKHEFVAAGLKKASEDVSTLDVAKRIIDYGYHPPTVYFPLIVPEALMIEPTETESKETLDDFAEVMARIADEAVDDPELLKNAPHKTPVRRIDEVRAARVLVLKYKDSLKA
jgi:glycine dehydrogenase subunit 2